MYVDRGIERKSDEQQREGLVALKKQRLTKLTRGVIGGLDGTRQGGPGRRELPTAGAQQRSRWELGKCATLSAQLLMRGGGGRGKGRGHRGSGHGLRTARRQNALAPVSVLAGAQQEHVCFQGDPGRLQDLQRQGILGVRRRKRRLAQWAS